MEAARLRLKNVVKYPIFVFDDASDIMPFENWEQVHSLEPIDIRNGEYVGYDSDGYLLILNVSSLNYDADYTIARSENLPATPDKLRKLLAKGLTDGGTPESVIEAMSYDEIIEQARSVFAQNQAGSEFNLIDKLRTLFGRLLRSG